MGKEISMKVTITSLVIILCAGGSFLLYSIVRSQSYTPANEVEAKAIMAAIQHAYDAMAIANETGNLAVLDDALIDHWDFLQAIGPEHQRELQDYIHEILGLNVTDNFGYLTAMKNRFTHELQGRKLLQEAKAKAKAESRQLTDQEWQTLKEKNHGELPALPDTHLPKRRIIAPDQYQSIEVKGDKARAVYDDGIRDETAILVRVNGRWLVAGIF